MLLASLRFVEIFCAVVEAGNYTRAANQLGITAAAVSRAIARHEAELGAQLFLRTTRSVQLTEAGQQFFDKCRQALALLEEAERGVSQQQVEPQGLVRLSVPSTYGHYRVLPMIRHFTERYPRVALEVNIANTNVDIVTERYDLAVRMGVLDDSSLIVRKLEDAAFAVFASPSYLQQHGRPQHPSELSRHTCVTFIRPSTGRPLPWLFREPEGGPFEIVPEGKLRCSGDPLGCATLARHGAGLAQTYRCIVEEDVERGRLVEVLEAYTVPGAPFSLLQPVARVQPPAVRLFADLLVEHCSKRRG